MFVPAGLEKMGGGRDGVRGWALPTLPDSEIHFLLEDKKEPRALEMAPSVPVLVVTLDN